MKTHTRIIRATALGMLFAAVWAGGASAQDKDKKKETSAEEKARLARRGAGLVIGSWAMVDDPASGSTTTSDSPIGEGYFRKGMDQHLALETSAGVWRRVITTPASGGLGGSSGGSTTAVLIPQMTSIKLYPFTTPSSKAEPFLSGGLGIVIGIQSQSGSGGLLGGSGGVSQMLVGFGGGTAAGFEWKLGNSFGILADFHYTYLQFFDELAGEKLYRGTGVKAGLTYRFQY